MPTPTRVNFVQAGYDASGGSTYASPTQSVTAGNTLVACIGGDAQAAQTVASVTDTAGHTYTKVAHVFNSGDGYRQEVWVAANVTAHASNVVTATWSASIGYRSICVMQYAGLDAVTPLDDTKQTVALGPGHTTPTLTGTTAESVHILMSRWGYGSTGFPAGFTEFTTAGGGVPEVADKIVTGGAFSGTYTTTSSNYFLLAVILKAATAPPAVTARVTQSAVEVLYAEPIPGLLTQSVLEVLLFENIPAHLTQSVVEVLYSAPPEGGGEVLPAPGPPVVDAQTGQALRLFVEFKGRTPVTPGAEVPRWLLAAETGLRDAATWHGGHKPARLVSVTPITRELADDLRAVECRIVVADVDRLFRTYGTWGPLTGDYCAVYVVSDEVRYAEGVPYRLFAGLIQSHRALPGFQYEFVVQDVFSTRLARLDESPRIPPYRLTLADFPGMDEQLEGKAAQIVLGEASDEIAYLPDRGPQGVVPPQRLGVVNFATLWGGSSIDADAYIWSQSSLVAGGVWNVYYNPPDTPDVRQVVPLSSYGVDVWTPGKPGWAMTGLATDYVDYNGRRYTPFFVRRDHPLAQAAREGKVLIAGNLFGVSDAGDGSGPYLDSAARLWQWLIVNQLFVPYTTGDYADVPLLDETYGILDTDSVEAAHLAHHARVAGGYIVGFLLGTDGKQETLRHVLGELCAGADLEQGINRHGQAMLAVEDVAAAAVVTFTDLHDIEEGAFETWIDAEAYVDRIEHQYGWRYVPPSAPVSTPAEGEPLPKTAIPKEQQQWTSGLVVTEHAAARALHSEQPPQTRAVENRVVRSPVVAANLETTWLARAVGPEPMFEGPLAFRLTTGWQGLGVTTGVPIDLGTVIAITHTEGYGQHGYLTERGVVRKITVDPQRARVTLEGRLLTATTPATGE